MGRRGADERGALYPPSRYLWQIVRMNAPFDHSNSENDSHDLAMQRASQWRGDCIQQFAELELLIVNALHLIAASKPSSKVKSSGKIRQQFDELKRLTSPKASKIHFVSKSLSEIDRLIEWRAHLTHGVLGVWLGTKGQWLLTFQHHDPNDGPIRMHALTAAAAGEKLDLLTQEVATLRKRVNSVKLLLQPKAT